MLLAINDAMVRGPAPVTGLCCLSTKCLYIDCHRNASDATDLTEESNEISGNTNALGADILARTYVDKLNYSKGQIRASVYPHSDAAF